MQLALSAASPIYRGFLADTDCRWNVIAASVDDRTREERGINVSLTLFSVLPECWLAVVILLVYFSFLAEMFDNSHFCFRCWHQEKLRV